MHTCCQVSAFAQVTERPDIHMIFQNCLFQH
jgi:hypothetical protein